MRNPLRKNLDRDVAVQLRIACAIDPSHAPFADLRGDLVDAETRAWRERQTAWIIGGAAPAEPDYSRYTPQG